MANLMKIFVKDDEGTEPTPAPPQAANGAAAEPALAPVPVPTQTPEPVVAENSIQPSEAELAATELERMIVSNAPVQSEPIVAEPVPQVQPAQAPAPIPTESPFETVAAPVAAVPAPPVETPAAPAQPAPTEPASSPSLSGEEYQSIHIALSAIAAHIKSLPTTNVSGEPLLRRIGPGGLRFVEQAMQVAERESGILPRSFDLDNFRAEGALLRNLGDLSQELQTLADRVATAEAAIGSGAFGRALSVYQAAKLANASSDLEGFLS